MGYSMYICPECQKVFKVQGNNKKVKCSNCSVLLKDSNVSMEEWTSLSSSAKADIKNSISSANKDIDTPIEVIEEPSKTAQPKPQMTTCPQCGAEIPKDSKFCTECGYSFVASSTPTVVPIVTPVVTSSPQPQKSRSLFDGYEDKVSSAPVSNSTKPSTNLMKCPSCGADIDSNSKQCSYCGASITYSMRREQEQVNKEGCPKCGSSNVQFKRENHGEVRGKKSKKIIHKTVGFCKDCGYTWYPSANNQSQNNSMKWWVLGWIFFFPAPLMVLIWRKKNTWDIKIKIAVTVVFWILFFAIGSPNKSKDNTASSEIVEQTETEGDTETDAKTIEPPTKTDEAEDVSNDEPVAESTTAEDNADAPEIELIAGDLGEYGKELILNEGSEFEDKTIGFFVPSGKYEVKNIGDKRTQVNVYKNEKNKTDEGWEEWADGNVELLDAGATTEMTVEDGYFINIDEPSHISIKLIEESTPSEENNAGENKDFIKEHENEIVAAAKLALDNFIDGYDISLAPQKWTIAKFDETKTTVIAMTDITYNGETSKYIYVGTLNINSSGKVDSAKPHYIEVNGEVLGDDGYAKDVFDKIKSIGN